MESKLINALKDLGPEKLDDLWNGVHAKKLKRMGPGPASMEHLFVDQLFSWASDQQMIDVLSSRERCHVLVSKCNNTITQLGMFTKHMLEMRFKPRCLWYASCIGCNTPHDVDGGSCRKGKPADAPEPVPIDDSEVSSRLHTALITMYSMVHLLTHEESDILASLIVNEAPAGLSQLEWTMQNAADPGSLPSLPLLIGILDNCSQTFPKAAQVSAALIGLIVCRRPATALLQLDPETAAPALRGYMRNIFNMVHNSECIVELINGIVDFINITPLLYHLGCWKAGRHAIRVNDLVTCLASLVLNMCHSATSDDWEKVDCAPNLEQFPELIQATVHVGPLLCGHVWEKTETSWRGKILESRPMTYAVAAGIEILGHWSNKGIVVSQAINSGVSYHEETIAFGIDEYLSQFRCLFKERRPELGGILAIAEGLAECDSVSLPANEVSVLRDPLNNACMRCSLSSCRATRCENGEPLLRCSGGCSGLSRYCCKEHQKEHWRQHKAFCKIKATM